MAIDHHSQADDELIVRAYHGDREAFGDLYERHLRSIFRYVYFRIGDPYEAEDLTEAIFLKAWEAIGVVRLENFNFKAWIYRIAHNAIIDRYRTQRTEVSLEVVGTLKDPESNPEDTYDINEWIQDLAGVIRELDVTMQDVIIYRFIQGYSHAETAALMGKSEVYIRVLQHRALQKLKDRIKREKQEND